MPDKPEVIASGSFFWYGEVVAFAIKQEKFEGPLEVLAQLIESEKLEISEISLARVADEYVAYVKSQTALNPEELAEFLVIAAQLMLVKSRTLLPNLQLSEEEEVSIEELETRLKEYHKFRELAREIQARERREIKIVSREAYATMEPVFFPPPQLTGTILEQVFRALLAAIPKIEKLAEEKIKRVLSLEDKITHIMRVMEDAVSRGFSDLVGSKEEKMDVIVSFLAILELVRQKWMDVDQESAFSDIVIKKLSS